MDDKITRWSVDAVIASSFPEGRVFLARRRRPPAPPTGGLGLTSAVHDVNNICWKLAAVLDGTPRQTARTYEPERRSSVARNGQRSLDNALNHFAMISCRLSPENAPEQNRVPRPHLQRPPGGCRASTEVLRGSERSRWSSPS